MNALIVNRIGDCGYIIGVFGTITIFNTLDVSTIFGSTYLCNKEICEFITIFLVIGVIGKSAQLGQHKYEGLKLNYELYI